MTSIELFQGDNRVHLKAMIASGRRFHSCVCDPPYGLVSVTKRFGKDGAAPAKFGSDGAFQRAGAGFMGSRWDGTGIERDPEFWKLVWEVLLPGGYCIAFSGARTGHWQACAMEQAGFIMHPMTGWAFGSGFPKAHNAAKAIDKKLGTPGSVLASGAAVRRGSSGAQQHATGDWIKDGAREYQPGEYVPGSEEAAQWDGWAYGAQSLKPALEPIYIGQKPFSEKDGVLNLLKHGVGAMNIDGCRVPIDTISDASQLRTMQRGQRDGCDNDQEWGMSRRSGDIPQVVRAEGRHPANLLHDGSDEVVALFPDSKGQQGDVRGDEPSGVTNGIFGELAGRVPSPARNDSGSAARFFNAFPVEPEALYYHAKASTRDRVTQCRICGEHAVGAKPSCDCVDNSSKRSLRGHPTVKPIGLMRHLVRLVTPPGGTVLDPFAGTGTTGQAAREEGFDCILMEADADYCGDIRARLFPTTPDSPIRTEPEHIDEFAALLGGEPEDEFTALL